MPDLRRALAAVDHAAGVRIAVGVVAAVDGDGDGAAGAGAGGGGFDDHFEGRVIALD